MEVYGHVIADDVFADAYVIPMNDNLADIQLCFGAASVDLPTGLDIIAMATQQEPSLFAVPYPSDRPNSEFAAGRPGDIHYPPFAWKEAPMSDEEFFDAFAPSNILPDDFPTLWSPCENATHSSGYSSLDVTPRTSPDFPSDSEGEDAYETFGERIPEDRAEHDADCKSPYPRSEPPLIPTPSICNSREPHHNSVFLFLFATINYNTVLFICG